MRTTYFNSLYIGLVAFLILWGCTNGGSDDGGGGEEAPPEDMSGSEPVQVTGANLICHAYTKNENSSSDDDEIACGVYEDESAGLIADAPSPYSDFSGLNKYPNDLNGLQLKFIDSTGGENAVSLFTPSPAETPYHFSIPVSNLNVYIGGFFKAEFTKDAEPVRLESNKITVTFPKALIVLSPNASAKSTDLGQAGVGLSQSSEQTFLVYHSGISAKITSTSTFADDSYFQYGDVGSSKTFPGLSSSDEGCAPSLIEGGDGENETCKIKVRFNPRELGSQSGEFSISYLNGPDIVTWTHELTGTGIMEASVVLGQADFATSSSGAATSQMNTPKGVFVDASYRLYVADSMNHRVLIWNMIPTEYGEAADIVIGDGISGTSQSRLNQPSSVYSDGTSVYVADTNNNRLLKWNAIPDIDAKDADVVIGQANFSDSLENRTNGAMPSGLNDNSYYLPGMFSGGSSAFALADKENNRILFWNSPVIANDADEPDYAIGQSNFPTNGSGLSNSALEEPEGVFVSETKIFVADTKNNRVLIWNSYPGNHGEIADLVLGQGNFETKANATTSQALYSPTDVALYNEKLLIVDSQNNRIIIHNNMITENNASASEVFGKGYVSDRFTVMEEPDITNGKGNEYLKNPHSIFVGQVNSEEVGFVVADTGHHRLLVVPLPKSWME